MSDATDMTEEITYCAVHPDRETSLRCNKCGRLMCAQCAVQTPVGYRCRECVRTHEDKFFSATNNDYLIVGGVCAGLTGIAAALMSGIGIPLFFGIILAFPLGGGISEVALRVTQRRRGRQSALVAAAGAVMGGLGGAFIQTYLYYSSLVGEVSSAAQEQLGRTIMDLAFQRVTSDIALLLFVGLVAMAIYGRYQMRF